MRAGSQFSARTSWDLGESSYAAAVREARDSGRRLYDLSISNPTRCGFRYSAEELLGPLQDATALVYDPQPCGLASARHAVARYYADHGADVSAEQLVLTASTSESYSFLFRLLCDAGDEVLIAQPSYPLFDFLAELDDVRLRTYPLFYDHGWWIDRSELERGIGPRTRAIVVVHPNNPTGHWTHAAERQALEELCVRHGLALIVDEVFLDYSLRDSTDARSFACGPHPALTFVLSGLSKICGLPQMKAAWIAAFGPEAERQEAMGRLEVIADTFLSLSAPIQLAMPSWLGLREGIQKEILARVNVNLAVLEEIARTEPERLQVFRTDAGWSAVIGLPRSVGDADFAERMVRERGVILHPGSFYGTSGGSAVVSLIVPVVKFREGIRRVTA